MIKQETPKYISWLNEVGLKDLPRVGGKNAALGEMMRALEPSEVAIPHGFVITSLGYQSFIAQNKLLERISQLLEELNTEKRSLKQVGQMVRDLFLHTEMPEDLASGIKAAYAELSRKYSAKEVDVAVRSSATTEDLPTASFAGQQESFLNVRGYEELLQACKRCFASLFRDQAIIYRQKMGFDHLQISLCVGVQKMVRADLAGAGVIFTRDQQSGFPEFMSISMGWGLGETVVQGLINPDTFVVYKPFVHHSHCLPFLEKRLGHKQKKSIYSESGQGSILVHTDRKERISYVLQDEEVLHLCRSALIIEKHFQKPMDIEWAKDGETDQLFVLQARPISSEKHQEKKPITMYRIKGKPRRLLTGISIGEGIASGKICLLNSVDDIKEIGNCPLLVSEMANTSWLPIMQQRGAKGLITDFGGTNSHAAILSRELGIPAILGTVQATYTLHQAQEVTIVALEGDFGHVYEGQVAYDTKTFLPEDLPTIHSKICLDLESAQGALRWWRLPCAGVGLVNLDFILKQFIRIHPLALLHSDDIQERSTRLKIDALTKGYPDPIVYFQTIISSSLATIAATHYPLPVVVRLNSLTSQEFAQLRGGKLFETGTLRDCRGTSRYLHEKYKQAFLMELETIVQVRQRQCLDNLQIMVPYCQTPHQANALFDLMQKNNISPKEQGLQVHLSCDCQENLLQGKALRKHFSHVSLNVSQFLEMVHEMGKYPEKEQILYQLVQTWTDTGGEVALRAHKAEDLKFLLDSALQAGIARFTVPPEEVALLQEMLAQTEKK